MSVLLALCLDPGSIAPGCVCLLTGFDVAFVMLINVCVQASLQFFTGSYHFVPRCFVLLFLEGL